MYIFDTLTNRLKRGCMTMAFPKGPAPDLPDRHGGALRLDPSKCSATCALCVEVCPSQAIVRSNGQLRLDLGRCLFCADCVTACPQGAIELTLDGPVIERVTAAIAAVVDVSPSP